jgi:putative ABC transport system substrate-binding protein
MASYIGRRKFLATLGGAAAAWPLAARAQQPAKPPTIGFLGSGTLTAHGHWVDAFLQRLRVLGWIEGRNLVIEYRWGGEAAIAPPCLRPSSSDSKSILLSHMRSQ